MRQPQPLPVAKGDAAGRAWRQYRLVRRLTASLVRACGALPVLLGLAVLLGWFLDIPRLRSVLPGAVEMKANTAVAIMLAGTGLLLNATRDGSPEIKALRTVARALGVLVASIGAATLVQYMFGVDFGIDQALVRDEAGRYAMFKGRMSPFSAAAFVFLGAALVALPTGRLRPVAGGCAGVAAVVGLVSLTGYFWGAAELLTDEWAPPVAIHSAAAFVLLGVGIWTATYRFSRGRRSLRFLLDPIELKIMASFIGSLVVLIAVGGLTYGSASEYSRHARQLAEVKAFRGEMTELHAAVADAIFAQRTFAITGDPAYAQLWASQTERLELARHSLASSPDSGDAERSAVEALDRAVSNLVTVLQEAIEIRRAQGAAAAHAFISSGRDAAAMAELRGAMAHIDGVERVEEENREALLRHSRQRTLAITLLALVAAAAVLGAVFVAIRREMNARSDAERALRRGSAASAAANRFLESLIQNIPHMIFVKDAKDLRFVRMNRAGERLTGLAQADLIGKSDYDFFPASQADFFVAKDRQVLARGDVLDIREEEIHTAHDGVRLLHTKKIPVLDENGRATHLLGIAEDVTDARANEKQIQLLNEALSERAAEVERVSRARATFLATMSHEIRTPMNGMLGMLELLSLSPLDEKQRQALNVVSESGQSLLRIIDDILDFSKIEAEKLELREEVASVAAIVRDIQNIHSTVASSKGLPVTTTVDPALSPAVWVDALRLRQILNNFVSNAVKFTTRGRIEIRVEVLATEAAKQSLRLSVIDSGTGISPEEQERLFQPFVQAAAGGASGAGGTGLGLAISRRLAQLMGGTVRMASAVGQGTTLSLEIAVRTAPPELLPRSTALKVEDLRRTTEGIRAAPSVAEAEAEGTLILLVDDHPVNRLLLQQQVESLGYAAEVAVDGAQGLERWRSGRFGLVLTDCQMPRMSGYELARRIREAEAAEGRRRTPVIACTAMALEGEVEKCLAAGMDDVAFKPVELRLLLEKLQRWLPLASAGPAAAAAPAPSQPHEPAPARPPRSVDTDFLAATWGSDPKRIESIVAAYVRSAREDYAALRAAMARRDLGAVREVAHRMLGASRMVGAHGLAESCQRVNAAGRNEDREGLAAAMREVDAEFARLTAEFGTAA